MNILFWCEFPEETDFEKLNVLLKENKFKVKTYMAVRNPNQFKKIRKYSNIKIEGVWPTLPFKEGYWFSGFCSKNAIDSLHQYKGMKIKIDLETPIPVGQSFKHPFHLAFATLKYFLKSGKNKNYLKKKIKHLAKTTDIILSTYPLPRFMLNKLGFIDDKRMKYNYFYYSTVLPKFLKPVYKLYFKQFMKNKDKKKTYFALGLIGPGIFRNEPVYSNLQEFKEEVSFFKKNGVKNLVIFELGALLKRENPSEWISYIKSIQTK